MKKVGKIILIILGVLLVLFCGFVGFVIVDGNKQVELLNQEFNKLMALDLTNAQFEIEIVTKDEYAVIEKTVKTYLKEYSDNCKEFVKYIDEFNFEAMFTADNFQKDGPDFINSKGNLSNLKENLNNSLDKLIEMSNEEYIVSLIEDKDIDNYYIDMYKEYMFGSSINSFDEEIKNYVDDMKKLSNNVNLFLDDCYSLYDFMSNNRKYWEVKDDIVYFDTDDLVNQYNSLINAIIKDANKLAEYENNYNSVEDNSSSSI